MSIVNKQDSCIFLGLTNTRKKSYTVSINVEKWREDRRWALESSCSGWRKELGYSREELAGRLGVTASAVGNYETGVHPKGRPAAAV